MRNILFQISILAMIWCLNSSCKPPPPDCKEYHDLSAIEKEVAVRTYSVEKNFDLMRCRDYIEGFDSRPRDPIVDGGHANIPFLLSKLRSEDKFERQEAAYILTLIDDKKSLPDRDKILREIDKATSDL
jgi:hypothetical protein